MLSYRKDGNGKFIPLVCPQCGKPNHDITGELKIEGKVVSWFIKCNSCPWKGGSKDLVPETPKR